MGESWHNNHHAYPGSAKMGLLPGQTDLGWWLIRTFEASGLATNIKTPDNLCPRPGLRPVQPRRPAGGTDVIERTSRQLELDPT
jgi:stearoyl-CoA desaturase (delta-9 desaturase)